MRIVTAAMMAVFLCFMPITTRAKMQAIDAITKPHWSLRDLDGRRVPGKSSKVAVLIFGQDHLVGGKWACNNISPGDIRWAAGPDGRHGIFAPNLDPRRPSIITAMLCPNDTADRFWKQMLRGGRWSLRDRRLEITFADGTRAGLIPE